METGLGNAPALPELLTATPSLALSPSAVFWQRGEPGFGWESPGADFPSHTWRAKMIFPHKKLWTVALQQIVKLLETSSFCLVYICVHV